ncbi:hypothetical protein RvY_01779-1 [Ramazzottius varieornatus]|uniref:Uncharacterized protein n=1 Tax=Ramazzottius varieornatus TaxID=947166 RepID=A0A1D1UKZ2_RAMVA|nr:hypothetical protein RvY_01779-1 [Ramazzottius varieornatus]
MLSVSEAKGNIRQWIAAFYIKRKQGFRAELVRAQRQLTTATKKYNDHNFAGTYTLRSTADDRETTDARRKRGGKLFQKKWQLGGNVGDLRKWIRDELDWIKRGLTFRHLFPVGNTARQITQATRIDDNKHAIDCRFNMRKQLN